MPTSTTNTYEISLRLLENTPFAVAVNFDNRCQVKPPVLMRGVPSILRIKLFKYSGLVKAAELSALYTGFRLVIANDFDDTTAPLLVSDENGATVDAQNDCIVLPISEMNTVNLEALIGTRERLDLGAELQLFKPVIQDEPIEAWQFPIGVQNRRDLTGTATPAPGSVNYYKKDEVYTKEETDEAIAEGGGGGSQTLILEAAPTASTEGKAGQRALVSTTGDTYICVAIDDSDPSAVAYTWKQIANDENVYHKNVTYTKIEVDTAIANAKNDGVNSVTTLSGASATAEPGKVYSLNMSSDFELGVSTVNGYGESVLFVTPGNYAFSVASGIALDAEMVTGYRYRLLISWTPYGVHVEQTAEWEVA